MCLPFEKSTKYFRSMNKVAKIIKKDISITLNSPVTKLRHPRGNI